MAYLNYQIEHHLFPSMPQFHHPLVSRRVQALFAKHGVKYDNRLYADACRDTWGNIRRVGNPADGEVKPDSTDGEAKKDR